MCLGGVQATITPPQRDCATVTDESPEALVNLLVRERVLAVKKKDVMDVTPLSDSELALALKGGDERAFEELVRRHQGRVYAVAYRLTGNREDALDIAQESFVKAYRKIDAWQPRGGFLAWLLRLTTNQAIDTLRRRKRQRHDRLADDRHGEEGDRYVVVSTGADSAREVWAHEIGERVRTALTVLSKTQRTVFVLRHYEGLQLSEIADEIGCTVGSVKVHLFRALKKLQRQLGDLHEVQSER
jgi:RNA polymerase sigma-70 factor (ECF subfamily)